MNDELRRKLTSLDSFLFALDKINRKVSNSGEYKMLFPVIVYLWAFIFELIIKIFYELDTGHKPPLNHYIDKIYFALNGSTQKLIKKQFEDNIQSAYSVIASIAKEDLYDQNLEEILTHNADIVMHFKYELQLEKNLLPNTGFLTALRDEINNRIEPKPSR